MNEQAPFSCSTHLFLVLLQLFVEFLGLVLGVLELLAHLHVLQVQLGEYLLLALNELGQLAHFPEETTQTLTKRRNLSSECAHVTSSVKAKGWSNKVSVQDIKFNSQSF